MAYGIVKQSGGGIFVYSEEGKKTTFKIYFPRVYEAADAPREERADNDFLRWTETILVVEDEAMVRNLTVGFLRKQGYTVLEAAAGEEALLIGEHEHGVIDLILTDVVMPKMSGSQLIERLKKRRKDFKVLYMSGYTEEAIVRHGVLEKGINLIHKPFSFDELARKVRDVLDI